MWLQIGILEQIYREQPAKRVDDDLVFWYVRNNGMTL